MNNFFNATASMFFVACLALFTAPVTKPEPAASPTASPVTQSALAPSPELGEMLRALNAISNKLDATPNLVASDKFDSGGSDGATNTPTWPNPSQPKQPISPTTNQTGSGSTGSGPAGYSRVVQYYGNGSNGGYSGYGGYNAQAVYNNSFGSTGGYSQPLSTPSPTVGGLLSRIRSRTAQPLRSNARNVTCVDGVCY